MVPSIAYVDAFPNAAKYICSISIAGSGHAISVAATGPIVIAPASLAVKVPL